MGFLVISNVRVINLDSIETIFVDGDSIKVWANYETDSPYRLKFATPSIASSEFERFVNYLSYPAENRPSVYRLNPVSHV